MVDMDERHLVTLAELAARSRVLLDLFGRDLELFGRALWWNSASNLLFPAAALAEVTTNASRADLYDAFTFCSTAASYDAAQSRVLDDYLSAWTRFHFVWNAYEVVRCKSTAGRRMMHKDPSSRLTLQRVVPPAHLQLLTRAYHRGASLTKDNPVIREKSQEGREVSVLGKAGLLMREFRHYIFHGNEAHPEPDDFRSGLEQMLDGEDCLSDHAYRLVAFTRLALHVTQALVQADLPRDAKASINSVPFLSNWHDHEFEIPCRFALNLASYRPDGSAACWSPGEVECLADGCGVSREVLDAIVATEAS